MPLSLPTSTEKCTFTIWLNNSSVDSEGAILMQTGEVNYNCRKT